jgi:anti-anti-sigma factor
MTDMTDAHPQPDDPLTVAVGRRGATAWVTLAGELDLHTSGRLARTLAELVETGPDVIEIDAAALTFADSAGLRALLVARDEFHRHGATLRLTAVSEPLDRILAMTGLREVLEAPTPD